MTTLTKMMQAERKSHAKKLETTTQEVILRGDNFKVFCDDKSEELVLAGAAGTGKTMAILLKLYNAAVTYPRTRILIARKTRTSLTETGLVTWEDDVLGAGHPLLGRRLQRSHRHEYRFSNGSTIVTGGLDNPEKILSSQWNIIYIQEATEITQADWEQVGGRLRNPGEGFRQLIGDCNPVSPTHWLYRRGREGLLKMYRSTHHDNPAYFDVATKELTKLGAEYIGRLERTLTGHRRKRFLEGVWAQAEGQVYPEYDVTVNLIDAFPVPSHWRRYVSIDWGYNDPLVIQWWAVDTDGALYLYREFFRTATLVEDAAREFVRLSEGDPTPVAVVCDHDLNDRMTFERHTGLETLPAIKDIKMGIQAVSLRLRPGGNGKPRLYIMRGCLAHEPDANLLVKGSPPETAAEIDLYVFDSRAGHEDDPVDKHNHGLDCLRYVCMHLDSGPVFHEYEPPTQAPPSAVPLRW